MNSRRVWIRECEAKSEDDANDDDDDSTDVVISSIP